jgi:hypothetical protein
MARVTTRAQLIQYCLRLLGEPVTEVNIDDDQIEDRIDDAIQFYQEYHSDAVKRTFLKHQLTQEDIDNEYITLPEAILSVFRVFPINGAGAGGTDMFSVKYQMHLNDTMGLRSGVGGGALLDYEMTKQYMSLIDMTLNGLSQQITFTRHMNRLSIEGNWKEYGLREGMYIVLEGYQVLDPDTYPDVYNDMMLKKHAAALLKKQWGQNLIKFEGMQLPGGVTLNGRTLLDEAKEEITKIEEEYDLKYAFPPDFFVG